MDCQKGKKEKSTGTLRCFSHASDPLGFGVWHSYSWMMGCSSMKEGLVIEKQRDSIRTKGKKDSLHECLGEKGSP